MSNSGDMWREKRAHDQSVKQANSVLCWKCGTRVWHYEEECRRCESENENYEASVHTTGIKAQQRKGG